MVKSPIEADIKKNMYRYLLAHLSEESKTKLNENQQALDEVLDHLSRWVHNNKASLLVRMLNKVSRDAEGLERNDAQPGPDEDAVDFCDELESL